MTEVRSSNYWISSTAIYITLNAMGNPDYVQCNVVSNAYILCYIKDIKELGYDAGHNYQRWPLSAAPTFFEEEGEKFVYVAIPKSESVGVYAPIVFPSEKVDLYGKNAAGEQKGSTDYYYIYLQASLVVVTNADGTQERKWKNDIKINTGTLSSDEAIAAGGENAWWKYSSVDDTVEFTKTISKANFEQVTTRDLFFSGDKQPLTGVARDVVTDKETASKIVTSKYLTDFGDKYFLSKTKEDAAEENIVFRKGLMAGVYQDGNAGACVDAGGCAEVESLYSRGRVSVGRDWYVGADGQGRLGDVTVDAARSPGAGEGDRVLVDGKGFELYMGADGKSHLWVDNANVRGKLTAAMMEVRKVSYSGGTLLLSNAGSTLAQVAAVRDATGAVVAYKCWAKADDGTMRTRNWWKVGMMALCQTYNVDGGNRRYWRLVVGVGQECLADGRWYDFFLLSNVRTFLGGAVVVPAYGKGVVTDGAGRLLAFGGVVPVVRAAGDMTSLAALVTAQDGTRYDDDRQLLTRRLFYGYEAADNGGEPDAPMAGDVVVQAGDEVRWNSRGNVIRLTTSADDGDGGEDGQAPSMAMYHGMGKVRTTDGGVKTVWVWQELTALLSPARTYINSDYFSLFSSSDGLANAINPYASISELKADGRSISAAVTDVRTGLVKAGVVIDGDNSYVNVTADTFYVTAQDGTRTAAVDKDGSFRTTSVHTESQDRRRRIDVEDGMMVFSTADSKAQIRFGLDGNGLPLLMFLKANGEVGYVLSANGGSADVPAVTGEALVGDVTGGFSAAQQTVTMPGGARQAMWVLSYGVALTARNVSGNAKTLNGNVVRVTVQGPSGQTWRMTSNDEKLLLDGEELDMTYTFTVLVPATAADGTLITVPDTAAVTVTADDGTVIGGAVIGKE